MDEKPIGKDERKETFSTADLAGRCEPTAPVNVPVTEGGERQPTEESAAPLLSVGEANDLRTRWDGIQTGFVDEPRKAVEQADSLVAEAMKRLAETFADERAKLEAQWDGGRDVSTEDLRLALRRYRSFFHRLLSI
ncbi:hypothetical protein Gbem_2013 [Citrifermentans bemidjiense Bem]|uniref:Uncharacterized protein n=1 Tax=Citrifermentans bemidjiense (strain ATCC BAA-1014 / DSM 16622 / JCM 12645 / Bem) TaxID=404380 RepID=B5ECJ1_CITBB|nr:hypothetical protein [Citrifermentans bemidjiense]ACH39026.1 hypothetical protein Gbem_2013 [Citrifermentans bemidjiense Bem]